MQKVLVVLATLLFAPAALATPTTGATEGEPVGTETGGSSTPAVTRSIALWTHGITAAASFVGASVYTIRGFGSSELSEYKDDCESGVPGACSRYEATERERRVDKDVGGVLLLYSLTSLSGLVFLGSTDPESIDSSSHGAASVLYGTSAALSAATAGLLMYTLKLRSDFGDASEACFQGDCSEIRASADDVENSLVAPFLLSGLSYVLLMSTTVWLWTEQYDISLAPALDSKYAGATLTGKF